jgi:hypothetical protein
MQVSEDSVAGPASPEKRKNTVKIVKLKLTPILDAAQAVRHRLRLGSQEPRKAAQLTRNWSY